MEANYEKMAQRIANLNKTKLVELARNMGLEDENIVGTYRQIMKLVRDTIESIIDKAEDEDQEVKYFNDLLEQFSVVNPEQNQNSDTSLNESINVENTALGTLEKSFGKKNNFTKLVSLENSKIKFFRFI